MSSASTDTVLSNQELAKQIQSLLSSSPPFIDDNSIKVLNQLLQPTIINTNTSDCNNLWSCLDSLQPPVNSTEVTEPFQLDLFLTNALSSNIQPIPGEIKDMYQQLMIASVNYSSSNVEGGEEPRSITSNNSMQILDDGSVCLSCSLSPIGLSDVTLTPHSIILSPLKSNSNSSLAVGIGGINSNWWDFGWKSHGRESEKIVMIARKVWKPEVDKISVKCSWWGFEMINLDQNVDRYLETLKTISEVLNFIVEHIPEALSLLPPVALLKTILPIISTIAGFFIWYWKKVENDDTEGSEGIRRGNGVILAATWILPVALVPREWKKDEVILIKRVTVGDSSIAQSDHNSISREVSLAMSSESLIVSQDLMRKVEQIEEKENDDGASIAESLAYSPLVTSILSPIISSTESIIEPTQISPESIDNSNRLDKLPSATSTIFSQPQPTTSNYSASGILENKGVTQGTAVGLDEAIEIDLVRRSEKLSGVFSFVKRKK